MSFLAYVVVSLAPFDVRPQHWVGVPSLLPVVYGLPTQETMLRAEHGEFFLGGCVVSWNMPRWVLVW
jgi:hypothetical protein